MTYCASPRALRRRGARKGGQHDEVREQRRKGWDTDHVYYRNALPASSSESPPLHRSNAKSPTLQLGNWTANAKNCDSGLLCPSRAFGRRGGGKEGEVST